MMDLNGQLCVITGASAGIGAGFARALHGRGARVVLVARRAERLEELHREFESIRPGSSRVLVADLTSAADLDSLATMLRTEPVCVLVNNAGFGSFGIFETLPLEREREMVALNITAPLVLSHAALPGMKARGTGALITISSLAGFQPIPTMATYAGTKAFDLFFSLALAEECRSHGVSCLAVCPGPVATEFGGVARVPGTVTGKSRDTVEEVVRDSMFALDRGKSLVVPGPRARLLQPLVRLLPLGLRTRTVARQLRKVLQLAAGAEGPTRDA